MVQSFLIAFATRLSGLREVGRRCGRLLKTTNIASMSQALRRPTFFEFVRRLVEDIAPVDERAARDEALVAIDSMAVSLPATQRHGCRKINRDTVGVGLLWTFVIDAAKGVCPVRVLKVVEGAWHDAPHIREATLTPNAAVYLMDRGFYSLAALDAWLTSGVRFIVRARKRSLRYERLATVGRARQIGNVLLTEDIIACLGAERATHHPTVRLLFGTLKSGEYFILVSDRFDWSAERILAAYRKRWQIEEFHRILKDTIGLAHLYIMAKP